MRNGLLRRRVVVMGAQVATVHSPGQESYFLTDHIGSVVAAASSSGSVVAQRGYFTFGSERRTAVIGSGADNAEYGFVGKERSQASGFLYFEARYLDPATGRFLRPDPYGVGLPRKWLANPQSLNLYSYAENNPILFIDPSGLESEPVVSDAEAFVWSAQGTSSPMSTPSDVHSAKLQEARLNYQADQAYSSGGVQRGWESTAAGRLHKGADLSTAGTSGGAFFGSPADGFSMVVSPVTGVVDVDPANNRPDVDSSKNVAKYSAGDKLGNRVYIRDASGMRHELGHFAEGSIPKWVVKGAPVQRGEVIGRGGTSGSLTLAQTPAHIHYQIRDMNAPNPSTALTPVGLPVRPK